MIRALVMLVSGVSATSLQAFATRDIESTVDTICGRAGNSEAACDARFETLKAFF